MKRLGEILLERGSINVAELHTGLEACHHRGGRLGTHLLKFGFVEELDLLLALSEQLDVPYVSVDTLRRAPDALRRLVPIDTARRLQVMAFESDGKNVSVAMTAPRNPSILVEILGHVDLVIKPHVATEIAILTALSEMGEEPADTAPAETAGRHPADHVGAIGSERNADLEEWRNLWSPPALRSKDLLTRRGGRRSKSVPLAATFPGLAPIPNDGVRTVEELDTELFSSLLGKAEHRDEVGQLLLRRAAAVVERCFLLAVHSEQVVGWLAHGSGVIVDDVQSLVFSAYKPSILAQLKGPTVYFGRIEPGAVNDEILSAFGEEAPGEIAILPVVVKTRVVAYLVGDIPGHTIPQKGLDQLAEAVQKAGVAFEILIMKKKFLG